MKNKIIESLSHQYYAFRAECEADVHLFLRAIAWDILESDISSVPVIDGIGLGNPLSYRDVKITTSGSFSLEQLRWVADQIDDCHVIAESISPAASYTGERLSGAYASSCPTLHIAKITHGLTNYSAFLAYQQRRAKNALRDTASERSFVSTT